MVFLAAVLTRHVVFQSTRTSWCKNVNVYFYFSNASISDFFLLALKFQLLCRSWRKGLSCWYRPITRQSGLHHKTYLIRNQSITLSLEFRTVEFRPRGGRTRGGAHNKHHWLGYHLESRSFLRLVGWLYTLLYYYTLMRSSLHSPVECRLKKNFVLRVSLIFEAETSLCLAWSQMVQVHSLCPGR